MDDCSRGIKLEQISDCFQKIRSQLGCVVQSTEVKAMVAGHDRRPELGLGLARQCRERLGNKQNNN